MATAYHMVHYRRFEADGVDLGGHTLEGLCRAGLGQTDTGNISLWERAEDRLLDLNDGHGGQIILNKVADLSDAVFGEMCFVESRGLQALLQLQASKVQLSNITLAEIYRLDEREAPRGSQFIRGLAYWMAIGNHLLFVKTQAMNAERIHNYLDWLVKVRAPLLDPAASFKLQAEFDVTAHAGDVGDIRKLRLSGKSAPRMVIEPEANGDTKEIKTRRKIVDLSYVFEQAEPFAEVMLGKAKAESLVEALGPDEYLAVDASLAVRGRRTERSRQKMKELANDLADSSDAKVQIEGKDGSVSDGDAILRTRMPFSLAHDGSNLLEFDNVADQLQEVYSRFVRDGKIPA